MSCHENHEISYNHNAFISGIIFVCIYVVALKKFTHNKMSYVFNVGKSSPFDTSLPNGVSLISKFSLIFMN